MADQQRQAHDEEAPRPREVWVPADPARGDGRSGLTLNQILLAAFLFILLAMIVLSAAAVALLFINSDLILPGVSVMGVEVGSMTRAEATATIEERWQQREILLEHSDGVIALGAAELGIVLDAQATAERAHAQGRSLNSLLDVLQGQTDSPPIWSFDAAAAASTLAAIAPQLAVPAENANIRIEAGNVLEIPAAEGSALDVDRTVSYLEADPAAVLASGRLPLAMNSIAPDVVDVSALAAEARRMLSSVVTLRAYDPVADEWFEWTIGPEAWGSWLTLEAGAQDITRLQWSHDADAAAAYLDTQLPGLGEARYLDPESVVPAILQAVADAQAQVNTRVYHRPRQHVVQSGETLSSIGRAYGIPYPWIMQTNPGSELLQAGQTITIPSADEMLPLPVVENKRVVVSIGQQRAWIYEDEQLKWEWPVSTGIDESPTAPGIFQIQSHEENAYASNWDLWMPHFMGIYRPVPTSDFMNGFHGFPTRNGSTLLWTGDLGHQVTYGCILLSSDNATQLYDWAEEGVVVEVVP